MRRIRDDDRAFTPLAGTGLLVGVVVLLLAVLGAAMFGFIDSVAPPEGEFTVETGEDGEVVVTYVDGEPIAAEELYVRGQDPDGDVRFGAWPDDGVVRPGTRITVDAADGNEELRVVWEPVGFDRSETLAEHEPEGPDWTEGERVDPLGG